MSKVRKGRKSNNGSKKSLSKSTKINKSGSFYSPILKNLGVSSRTSTSTTIDPDSKQIKFSPVIGVRLFEVDESERTVWEKTIEIIDVQDSDSESEQDNQVDRSTANSCNNLLSESSNDIVQGIQLEEKSAPQRRKRQKIMCTYCANEPRWHIVEKVLGRRVGNDGKAQYLIKWQGFPAEENSWEIGSNLDKALVAEIDKLLT